MPFINSSDNRGRLAKTQKARQVRSQARARDRRHGGIIPLVAVVLLAILVVGGVAIDSARLQLVKAELRAAADNVARSAANELVIADSVSAARLRAQEIASQYRVGNATFEIGDSDIVFGRVTKSSGASVFTAGAMPPNSVRVSARRETGSAAGAVAMLFGSMFGVDSAEVKSNAIAGFRLVDVGFVLDRSSSMKLDVMDSALGMSSVDPRFMSPPNVSSRWQALDRAVASFIDGLKTNDADEQVGMVTYASDFSFPPYTWPASTVNLNLTTNLDACTTEMTVLTNSIWNGNTYIEAGMRDGISLLLSGPNARLNAEKIMIVFTDGIQNVGECRNAAVDAAASGITIHTITFGDYADQVTMAEVAAIGKGSHAHANDEATLKSIMQALVANMASLVD